jgi:subfamily B ATP-binding cassette protein HlyB/CyaB
VTAAPEEIDPAQAGTAERVGLRADGAIDPVLTYFVLMAKFLGVPADPAQLSHDRGQGDDRWSLEDLSRAAKRIGLISGIREPGVEALPRLPLPALAELYDGAGVLLLKIDESGSELRYLV